MKIGSPSLVLLPALNEEEGIGVTINELRECLDGSQQDAHFLVVDGNSKDGTAEVARKLGAEVVTQTGKGKGDAIECALTHVKDDLQYVIMTDADHTYPADYIPQMIEVLEHDPKVGMVCGNRFNSSLPCVSGGYSFYLGNKMLSSLHSLLNGVNLHDPLTGLRVIRWSALKDWKPKSKGFDIEVELNHYIKQKNYQIREIDISYRERLGVKKLKVRHGLVIFSRILGEAFDYFT